MAVSFIPLQPTFGIAHGDFRLVCSCKAMETHLMNCADVASRGSLELNSECCNRGQNIVTHFSTWQSRSVSLCGIPLRGWAVIAHKCFHYTITAHTVDRGSSSREDILRTDLLEGRHLMMVPRWKSLSSSVRPFFCQFCQFVCGDCMAVCSILYTCQQWVWLK